MERENIKQILSMSRVCWEVMGMSGSSREADIYTRRLQHIIIIIIIIIINLLEKRG
jgi:hypothetical protein